MNITINSEGELRLNQTVQQKWNGKSSDILQLSRFAGQEMMCIQKSDEEPDIYELYYCGFMVGHFKSMEDAKIHAPAFAKEVLEKMISMIED
jgi:hypothetical protein